MKKGWGKATGLGQYFAVSSVFWHCCLGVGDHLPHKKLPLIRRGSVSESWREEAR